MLLLAECESTMDQVAGTEKAISPSVPALIVTDSQTSGRGRQGRIWEETPEALYMTCAFVVPDPSIQLAGFSLVAGCAAHTVIESNGAKVQLKWPNDILTNTGDKLGGILIELQSYAGKLVLSTGIGININRSPDNVEGTSSLSSLGVAITRDELAIQLAAQLWENWLVFKESGFAIFHSRWTELAYKIGSWMQIDTGEKLEEGIFKGVTRQGLLRLEVAGYEKEIISGHVVQLS